MFLRYHLGLLTNLRSHKALREGFEISKGPSEISERVLRFLGGFNELFENPEEPSEVSVQGSFEPFDQTEISGRVLRFQRTFCDLREGSEISGRLLRSQGGLLRSQGVFF